MERFNMDARIVLMGRDMVGKKKSSCFFHREVVCIAFVYTSALKENNMRSRPKGA